ncbi:DDE-type integrase/transposase/recombinase [Paraburkholderia caballeronis]|uniref:Putative transposase n=1 Tax=Paraburkholderia caballeronis TaxID=416943 RepID=A0A1H7L4Q5_9BURK|nr:DDE-type integrase/transposase/recombinase [Paraburkholderia caballeronis]PXW28281.1 putative transposase [Paraburkholderia caballeronis]PXX03647.1 putative transposase [Paraburkholderia caballeronis]RAK04391.1 putative transposase [Paraburkholderia caballeronis]SED82139.1 putative transposase [Paraburkholderia caballeronis]SEK93686.1 putative transposase [Paraburkholderia caballeronis]
MLDKSQLTHIFDRLGTPPAGRKLILEARVEAPVRPVKAHGGNVITILASQKMGREIHTESNHIEFAAAVSKEYSNDILEYYMQPCELRLELVDESTGEIHKTTHIPDFLTIRDDGFTLEEWKSEAKLARLSEKYPYRYSKSSDGQWYAPQIEKQLADLGIRYRVCSGDSIPRRRVSNLLYLADYLNLMEPCPEDVLNRLHGLLRERGSMTFMELLNAPNDFDADSLNRAIAANYVVTDLDGDSLADKRSFRFFRDEALRDFMLADTRSGSLPGIDSFELNIAEGAKFIFEGNELTIIMVAGDSIVCNRQDGSTITLTRSWLETAHEKGHVTSPHQDRQSGLDLSRYSREDFDIALRRQALLEAAPGKMQVQVSDRTLRRWKKNQSIALANGHNEVLALVPHTGAKGNRTQRLSNRQLELMDDVIEREWINSKAISFKTCYLMMLVAFDDAGEKAPSYPTLIARIKARETNDDVRTRHGKRFAYQKNTFIDVLYHDTPAHGSRPFQYVHIDHTQLDIEVISSRTGKPLGRPWLTLAVDAWSRRIVAFYLTFDVPSYHSVMMTVRDMVRRFNRLPEFIVVDNGRDFMSDAFKSFLNAMGTNLRFRPAGQPRHGAVLERMFGRLNKEYIHNLAGNTKATTNVRMVTGSHLPEKLAEWTLAALYTGIQRWACEYYDQKVHPALDESPRDAFVRGMRESGTRPQKHIQFNRDFLIATCPPVDRAGTRRIHDQRGVKVDHRFYWNEAFRSAELDGQYLPVRYDPWDASSVYVRVKDTWVRAVCRNLYGLGLLTDVEKRALTAEFNRRHGTPKGDERDMKRLREFIQVFTPEGALAVEFARQAENKALYNDLQFANIEPVVAQSRIGLTEDSRQTTETPPEPPKSPTRRLPTPLQAPTAQDEFPDFDDF